MIVPENFERNFREKLASSFRAGLLHYLMPIGSSGEWIGRTKAPSEVLSWYVPRLALYRQGGRLKYNRVKTHYLAYPQPAAPRQSETLTRRDAASADWQRSLLAGQFAPGGRGRPAAGGSAVARGSLIAANKGLN
jgi:hypothetical protein